MDSGVWPEATLLRGAGLTLEPLRIDHADAMATVLADPDLYLHTGGQPPSVEELRVRYRRQVGGRPPDGRGWWLNWIVMPEPEAGPVGYVQATLGHAPSGLTAELAWVTGVAHQGNGYARRAAEVVRDWLCGQGVVALSAHIRPGHEASIAVAHHLGLSPTATVDDGEVLWTGPCSVLGTA